MAEDSGACVCARGKSVNSRFMGTVRGECSVSGLEGGCGGSWGLGVDEDVGGKVGNPRYGRKGSHL